MASTDISFSSDLFNHPPRRSKSGHRFPATEQDIANATRWYVDDQMPMADIAVRLDTTATTVRRLLVRNGVQIVSRRRWGPHAAETKRKLSEALKGHPGWAIGIPKPDSARRANMQTHLKTAIDLERYQDFGRLKILSKNLRRHKKFIGNEDAARLAFLEKFYFDADFNSVYDAWVKSGKNKWYYPSLDHKNPRCNGADWSLENLCFMTWFENRAKADMDEKEWGEFKAATNTHSSLFLESIPKSLPPPQMPLSTRSLEQMKLGAKTVQDSIREACIARMIALGLNPSRVADKMDGMVSRSRVTDYLGRRAYIGSSKIELLVQVLGVIV